MHSTSPVKEWLAGVRRTGSQVGTVAHLADRIHSSEPHVPFKQWNPKGGLFIQNLIGPSKRSARMQPVAMNSAFDTHAIAASAGTHYNEAGHKQCYRTIPILCGCQHLNTCAKAGTGVGRAPTVASHS